MKRGRAPEGEILYGAHAVRAALEARRRPVRRLWLLSGPGKGRERREEIRDLADVSRVPVAWVSRDALDRRARTADHQGVVAEVAPFPYAEEGAFLARLRASEAPALVLALDSIQDPRNLGAMVRSANVAGAQGVVIPKDRSAVVTAAAAKASAGAVEFTPVVRVTNLVRALRGIGGIALPRVSGALTPTGNRGGDPFPVLLEWRLASNVCLKLVQAPIDELQRPLWSLLGRGAFGGLFLLDGRQGERIDVLKPASDFFQSTCPLPIGYLILGEEPVQMELKAKLVSTFTLKGDNALFMLPEGQSGKARSVLKRFLDQMINH